MCVPSHYLPLLSAICLFAVPLVAEAGSCIAGSKNADKITSDMGILFTQIYHEEELILYMDDPVNCSGTAVGWHYCFDYSPSTAINRAAFALYRPNQSRYLLVESSYTLIEVKNADYPEGFHCEIVALPPFPVLEGDIVGACLPDDHYSDSAMSEILPLQIAATMRVPQNVYRIEIERCSFFRILKDFGSNTPSLLAPTAAINVYLEIGINNTSQV